MIDTDRMQVKEREMVETVQGTYTTKITYQSAYWSIQVWYAENGRELKRIETELD